MEIEKLEQALPIYDTIKDTLKQIKLLEECSTITSINIELDYINKYEHVTIRPNSDVILKAVISELEKSIKLQKILLEEI